MLKACIGLKQIDYIDRRHCGLPGIPEDIYRHERTLEELLLDFNAIQDLPPVSEEPLLFCVRGWNKVFSVCLLKDKVNIFCWWWSGK